MFIKSIEISGFKSYRSKLVLEFSPGTNVIVGRNGSGKSNVFDAIRFVLGESVSNIRADTRGQLLHEGVSERLMSASVVITFDNSDGRLPVEGSTVSVGRSVGVKKDEFFVQGRAARRTDVANMLEAAGFSRANPYYIVAQGKVAALTALSDVARLEALKEVAGTHVYEERRKESIKILDESNGKRTATKEVLDSIDARIRELEAESSQLSEYLSLDRSRSACEYVIHTGDLAKANEDLEELDRAHQDDDTAATALHEELQAAQARVTQLDSEVAALEKRLREATSEKSTATAALPKLAQKLVRAQAKREQLTGRLTVASELHAQLERDATELAASITAEEARLQKELAPAAVSAQTTYEELKRELERATRRVESLIDRTSRGLRFKNRKERDAHLQSRIAEVKAHIGAQDRMLEALAGDVDAQRHRSEKAAAQSSKLLKEVETARQRLADVEKATEAAASTRNAAFETKNDAYKAVAAADKAMRDAVEAADRAERALHATTPPPIRSGLEAVRGLAEAGTVTGIHGPLIDLFRPQHPRFNTAVDMVAGPALFNVVVESDDVAAAVIQHLISHKAGRVTLMPLSRLHQETVEYPVDENCRPLMDFLQYEPAFVKAVHQVFGRVLLCRSLDVASKYARSRGFTCVTLEGDVVNRKGALQGGFLEAEASRLVHVARMYEARGTAEASAKKKSEAEAAALQAEQQETAARGEESKILSEKARLRDNISRLTMEAERARADAAAAAQSADTKARERAAAEPARAALVDQQRELEAELASEMRTDLSTSEEKEMETLTARIEAMKTQVRSLLAQAEAARAAEQRARVNITDNLSRQLAEVRRKLTSAAGATRGSKAADATVSDDMDGLETQMREVDEEIARLKTATTTAEQELAAAEAELGAVTEQVTTARSSLDAARSEAARVGAQVSADTAQAQKLADRRRDALRRKEEAAAKLRDIGTLPTQEIEAVMGKRRKELLAKLAKINESLSKFGGINKKAAEQLAAFASEREMLLERAAELEKGDDSLRELIHSLDARKDQDIRNTFKNVAAQFRKVFAQLVPKGSAELRLLTDADVDEGGALLEEESDADEIEEDAADENTAETDEAPALQRGKKRGRASKGSALSEQDAATNAERPSGRSKAAGKSKKSAARASSETAVSAGAPADFRVPVERYRGVSVSVSFTDATAAADGRGVPMGALSGGQRSLVALALIMAIQRADPAPFYLFDEIDAALDDVHRAAVASVVAQQARSADSPAQFILTTFRPEMAEIGDRFFGVSQSNKISSVDEQSKAQTLTFLRTVLAEETRVGHTPSLHAQATGATKRAHMSAGAVSGGESDSDGGVLVSGGSRRSGSAGRARRNDLATVSEEEAGSD